MTENFNSDLGNIGIKNTENCHHQLHHGHCSQVHTIIPEICVTDIIVGTVPYLGVCATNFITGTMHYLESVCL